MQSHRNTWTKVLMLLFMTLSLMSCRQGKEKETPVYYVDPEGMLVSKETPGAVVEALPFSGDDVAETTVDDHGVQCIRIAGYKRISHPEKMVERDKCFIDP